MYVLRSCGPGIYVVRDVCCLIIQVDMELEIRHAKLVSGAIKFILTTHSMVLDNVCTIIWH
jgi:hypothetical protein